MKSPSLLAPALSLLLAQTALANNPIPSSSFTDSNGLSAAMAAAPMWYMASGTCMPSAAEDGNGKQTDGSDADNCNIGKLASGCPQQPPYTGTNTFYGDVPGEPFGTIPTYWKAARCGDVWMGLLARAVCARRRDRAGARRDGDFMVGVEMYGRFKLCL